MADLVLRSVKGSELTFDEMDNNFKEASGLSGKAISIVNASKTTSTRWSLFDFTITQAMIDFYNANAVASELIAGLIHVKLPVGIGGNGITVYEAWSNYRLYDAGKGDIYHEVSLQYSTHVDINSNIILNTNVPQILSEDAPFSLGTTVTISVDLSTTIPPSICFFDYVNTTGSVDFNANVVNTLQ